MRFCEERHFSSLPQNSSSLLNLHFSNHIWSYIIDLADPKAAASLVLTSEERLVERVYFTSSFIHHLTGRRLPKGEEKKAKEKRWEEDYWDVAYIHFSGPRRGGEERDETVKKGDASAGWTCGDWTYSAFSTLSITRIIRSEKWSGHEEGRSVWWWDWWIDVSLGE